MKATKLTLKDVATQDRRYLETIFALGDGSFGVRDSLPFTGNQKDNLPLMLVNGFYATNPITYGESAHGYAKYHQTIISLPSPRYLNLATASSNSAENNKWKIDVVKTELNLLTGELTEKFKLATVNNEHFELAIKSQALFESSHQYVITYQLKSLDYVGAINYQRPLFNINFSDVDIDKNDPRVAQRSAHLSIKKEEVSDHNLFKWITTSNTTKQKVIQSDEVKKYPNDFSLSKDQASFKGKGNIKSNQVLTWQFVRQVSDINQPLKKYKIDDYVAHNQSILNNFWHQSQVQISNEKLEKGIQYNLFQLFQSAGRNGLTNIAAKGITGPGYEGHYFWDTEMYMLPFFIYTQPAIAKQLLSYRYSILPQAKTRAKELGAAKGALFAWRTINGEEASAYYPAGTAAYHIDADIAHAVKLYFDVTGDKKFLKDKGAKIVLETARFWLSFGSWSKREGKEQFTMFKVTGPDEYTVLVDNNYYTNRMAKENLAFAAWLIKNGYIKADENEEVNFEKASCNMYLPYDSDKRITKQDDDSPEMPVWPFDKTPKSNYPLLLHYHPLVIYRYQVNKQPDTLLAEMLFPADQSKKQLERDYNYYEKITTHDSSLSRSIFSILASQLDKRDKAFNYYMDTSLMDLVDLQGNARDGLHEANLGGSWLGLTYGFAGMHIQDGILHITNHLPNKIDRLSFRICFQNRLLEVQLDHTNTKIELLKGMPFKMMVNDKMLEITK